MGAVGLSLVRILEVTSPAAGPLRPELT